MKDSEEMARETCDCPVTQWPGHEDLVCSAEAWNK